MTRRWVNYYEWTKRQKTAWNARGRRERTVRRSPRYNEPLKATGLGRARERAYVAALVYRYSVAWEDLLLLSEVDRKKAMRLIAVHALPDAGYFPEGVMTKDGKIKKTADDRAQSLVLMPRIQQAISNGLDQAGMSLEECFLTMASIMKNAEISPEIRLKAIDMRVKMTIGYAPTKTDSRSVNVNVSSDSMYEKEKFANPPPMKIVKPVDK